MKIFIKSAVKKNSLENGLYFAKLFINMESCFQRKEGNVMSFAKIHKSIKLGGNNVRW